MNVPVFQFETETDVAGILPCGMPNAGPQHWVEDAAMTTTQLMMLYPTHDDYVRKVTAAATQDQQAGFLLAADAPLVEQEAQSAPVPQEPRFGSIDGDRDPLPRPRPSTPTQPPSPATHRFASSVQPVSSRARLGACSWAHLRAGRRVWLLEREGERRGPVLSEVRHALLGLVNAMVVTGRHPPQSNVRLLQANEPLAAQSHHFGVGRPKHEVRERIKRLPSRQIDEDPLVAEAANGRRVSRVVLEPPREAGTQVRERVDRSERGHEVREKRGVEGFARQSNIDLGEIKRARHRATLHSSNWGATSRAPPWCR
jgi:hypothetical protein